MADNMVQIGGVDIHAYGDSRGANALAVANQVYPAVYSGEVIAGTAIAQMPNVACRLAWIKTGFTNTGTVYVGGSAVTAPNGTADATTGLPMIAGEVFGPVPVSNINTMYTVASAAAQVVIYIAVA